MNEDYLKLLHDILKVKEEYKKEELMKTAKETFNKSRRVIIRDLKRLKNRKMGR